MREKRKNPHTVCRAHDVLPPVGLFLLTVLLIDIGVVWAQTTCNNGQGRVLYERLPNQQLQGFDDDVVRNSDPPSRALEKCQDLCLRDRTASNNLVRPCTSFDFQPGSRIAAFTGSSAEYEESVCYLTREAPVPEGIGILMLVPNSVHFTEVCLSSNRPERECPSRRYVFERHPRKKLKLPVSDIKEITAANRSDCEDKCLNEFSFVCRSANFDSNLRSCALSRFTRRTHPELLEDDPNSDYLENTCLNAERRCDGLAVYVKEENKRLGGPFEVDIFNNMTLEECQSMCIRAEKYFCRSVEFDDQTKQCILSEEDSISQKDDISISSSPTHHFYDLVCLDNHRGTEYPDNSVTSHLFASGRRPDTAFQRFRNSRLGGEFHSEITGRSLSECLDECLRQTSFQCRSAVYSDRFRTCRLSRYNQQDGMRIIYDADYDYYENLMLGGDGTEDRDRDRDQDRDRIRPNVRPDYPSSHGVYRPGDSDREKNKDRYPSTGDNNVANRFQPSDGKNEYDNSYPGATRPHSTSNTGGDRYPPSDRYPADRYPTERYPNDRYPTDRNPPGRYPYEEKYPYGGGGGGGYIDQRYPTDNRYPTDDRYPIDDQRPGRYPPDDLRPTSRYPVARPGTRYPPEDLPGRYPIDDLMNDRGRYPARYPETPMRKYPYDDRDYYYPPPTRHPLEYPNEIYSGKDGRGPASSADRYKPSDRLPTPLDYDGRYPAATLPPTHDRRVTATGRYPADDGYPYDRPASGGRLPAPVDGGRPVVDNRVPSSGRYPVDDRYPVDKYAPLPPPHRGGEPYLPEDRYRPESKYGDRYPPVSENRFPVGNDRNPVYVYKYSNRIASSGYDRYPMSYDRDRGYDRYGNDNPQMYGSGYDRGVYDRGGYDRGGYDRGGGSYDRGGYDRGNYDRGGYGAPRPLSNGGYPYEIRPQQGQGYDNSPNAIGDSYGGFGPARPLAGGSRCDDADNFKQMGVRQKVRRQYVRRVLPAPTLVHCQRECVDAKDFVCRSFNYRETALSYDADAASVVAIASREREREAANCELSDRDTRELDMHNPQMFDGGSFDYYERSNARSGSDGECLDVSQTCNEEGMEFTLRTPEGFTGRIYTYGFYDRCFFRGNGGTANILRISGPQGYPECGTQRYGDTMTNIVVVQFADNVQTGRDKRFNLTCIFRGPGEAVVTSGYIGAGSGSPIPIEYLPAENTLSSKVRLMILYQNRPTTTIAVGDPLTFRLEPQDGYNQMTDIFATNVVARDPYSGRSIQLIDRYGCPVDSFVFPELDKLRTDDSLEARFNAFKIPESNFLVFEATVRSCRDGCQPAYCPGQAGRSEPSFGRRRRSLNDTTADADEASGDSVNGTEHSVPTTTSVRDGLKSDADKDGEEKQTTNNDYPEHVREMIEVFDTRDDILIESVPRKLVAPVETVCLSPSEYHGLITAVILLLILLLGCALLAGLAYRRYWATMLKNRSADRSRVSSYIPSALHQSTVSVSHEQFDTSGPRQPQPQTRSTLFNAGLQKTFATGNLSRMCQIPVINPIRSGNSSEFDDPSEPIYTDPSLFERSRSLCSIAVQESNSDRTEGFTQEQSRRSIGDFY